MSDRLRRRIVSFLSIWRPLTLQSFTFLATFLFLEGVTSYVVRNPKHKGIMERPVLFWDRNLWIRSVMTIDGSLNQDVPVRLGTVLQLFFEFGFRYWFLNYLRKHLFSFVELLCLLHINRWTLSRKCNETEAQSQWYLRTLTCPILHKGTIKELYVLCDVNGENFYDYIERSNPSLNFYYHYMVVSAIACFQSKQSSFKSSFPVPEFQSLYRRRYLGPIFRNQ